MELIEWNRSRNHLEWNQNRSWNHSEWSCYRNHIEWNRNRHAHGPWLIAIYFYWYLTAHWPITASVCSKKPQILLKD